ncbi:chromate efflux transporter [Roseobacteraceae bacterium S113]
MSANGPTSAELTSVFARIGVLSFGGPAAQIGLLQRETVDSRGWIDEASFLRGLSFCMMLPGPEAMQLATYIGWRIQGIRGGLIAGGLFVLPGAMVIAALSALYISFGTVPAVQTAFVGIQAAVLAVVSAAVIRLARKALNGPGAIFLACLAFIALFALSVPFPAVIAAAALWGLSRPVAPDAALPPAITFQRNTLTITSLCLVLWLLPLVGLWAAGGGLLFELARFFGQLALTTFGGAYAVLAYMTQTVVQAQGWLSADQMIDALGLAETTPGPLILVTQFVGHLAGHGQGGWALWLAAGAITLWMTFVPCFLWIFAGAPYLEALMARPRLARALGAISAAVVGVMASLALWFALNVLFDELALAHFGPARLLVPNPTSAVPAAWLCFGLAGGHYGGEDGRSRRLFCFARSRQLLWGEPHGSIPGQRLFCFGSNPL